MSELALREQAEQRSSELGLRAQPGLVLSIGMRDESKKGAPTKLDHFRAKPGNDKQFAAAAKKFHAEPPKGFGAKPRAVEIVLPSNDLGDALDIRWKAFGSTGDGDGYLKAIGTRNWALADELGGPDVLTIWEPNGDVRTEEIESWDDPLLTELGAKPYTVFRFLIPRVLGLTTWAEIATTSRISRDNLSNRIRRLHAMTQGRPFGLRLKLVLRPATARPVIVKNGQRQRIRSKFWALDLYTDYTVDEFIEELKKLEPVRPQIALPEVAGHDPDRDGELLAIESSLSDLPPPDAEGARTAQEPSAFQRPEDALLNRIAVLEKRAEPHVREVLLSGAFGVESAERLSPEQAERYLQALELDAETEVVEDVEVVSE